MRSVPGLGSFDGIRDRARSRRQQLDDAQRPRAKGISWATMLSRPRPQSTALFWVFKIVAVTLIAINVIWHGIVAMFLGGPVGLGAFLLAVVAVWTWSWVTMRR